MLKLYTLSHNNRTKGFEPLVRLIKERKIKLREGD